MTASLLPNGKQQFIDIDGNPLVAGRVYFYTPTTLIPKDTWQDAAQGSLNTNPVVCDSRGQATIYGNGPYRQVVTDAAGNTIWDKEVSPYGQSVFGPQVSILSASTTDLGTLSSNCVLITGTTTINSFGSSASIQSPTYLIEFGSVLALIYNATSMVLPGNTDITTAPGDWALVQLTNALGYWQVIAYFSTNAAASLGTAAFKNTGTSGSTVPLLNGNNVWSGSARFQKQTYGDEVALTVTAGASTPDFALSNNFTASVGVNYTMNNPINVQPGQSGVFVVTQTVGALTMTWGGNFKAPGGIATVSLSGVNGALDYFAYYAHSSTFIVITPILNPT